MGKQPPPPELSIVVVNWNTRDLLAGCLEAVSRCTRGLSHEVWVVDNGSADGSVEMVHRRFGDVHLIANAANVGYAAAANMALRCMAGRYAVLLNTDAVPTPDALGCLHAVMQRHPACAMTCGQLLHANGRRQHSTARFPGAANLLGNEWLARFLRPGRFPGRSDTGPEPVAVDSCIGACMMVRRAAIEQVGLLDERFFLFFEETDWARRLRRAGWTVHFVPTARIFHAQGQSARLHPQARILYYRSRYLYFAKWWPRTWWLLAGLAGARLAVNTLLTAAGVLLTGGRHPGLRRRLATYLHLVGWHLHGCPD